jgi:hypothetical protein
MPKEIPPVAREESCKMKHPIDVISTHALLQFALAHDLIPEGEQRRMSIVALNVLCWVMDHAEPGNAFEGMLAKLREVVKVEVVTVPEAPAGSVH